MALGRSAAVANGEGEGAGEGREEVRGQWAGLLVSLACSAGSDGGGSAVTDVQADHCFWESGRRRANGDGWKEGRGDDGTGQPEASLSCVGSGGGGVSVMDVRTGQWPREGAVGDLWQQCGGGAVTGRGERRSRSEVWEAGRGLGR